MIPYLIYRFNNEDEEPTADSAPEYHRRSPIQQSSDESDESDEHGELSNVEQCNSLSISPATVANALEIHDIHNHDCLDSIFLHEFLADLVQREYVFQVKRRDIKYFIQEVKEKIAESSGGIIPKKINKEVLLKALPTEKNFLLQIGHRVKSSNFIKFWQNYDVDNSGYIELKELKLLVQDYAQIAGEVISECKLASTIEELMSNLDTNKDGKIELEELSKLMNVEDNFMKNFCGRHYLSRRDFDNILSHYDMDAGRSLDKSEVMALINDILKHLETCGKNVPIPVLQSTYDQVMKVCDVNNSGTVQRRELALLLSCFE